MYNTMNKRQSEFYKQLMDYLGDENTINKSLAADMAILMEQIETANEHVLTHGAVLEQEGTHGQTRYVPNPAVAQREQAIKNLNVHARTVKLEEKAVEAESDLAKYLSGKS